MEGAREDQEDPGTRHRTLTLKGQELFQSNCAKYEAKIQKLISLSQKCFEQDLSDDKDSLISIEKQLTDVHSQYQSVFEEFQEFLRRSGAVESNQILKQHIELFHKTCASIFELRTIIQRKLQPSVSKSVKNSLSKTKSTSSSVAFRAKAEAARKAAEYARHENSLKRKQAQIMRESMELTADLELLEKEKEAVVADAEALVYEGDNTSQKADLPLHLTQATSKHIQDYVDQCADNTSPSKRPPPVPSGLQSGPHVQPELQQQEILQPRLPTQSTVWKDQHRYLDPAVQPFYPREFSQIFLKKELVMARLKVYDDKPENYVVWKSCFQSVIAELNISDVEQLDLLIKFLGPTSSKHAVSLRAANVNTPSRGLQLLWQRLDERYGAPELVESALRSRLEHFPRITAKNQNMLYELSDLLSEIESVKMNPMYSQLLAYFDSSVGINPIVSKLPYGVQDKWTNQAFRYKEQYKTPYPPFSFFVTFIHDLSKIRNDPSFLYDSIISSRPSVSSSTRVSARKTDVSQQSHLTRRNESNTVKCPYHSTGHSLNQCRAFRNSTYEERKEFLKKQGYCFRCCSTNSHLAKDCMEDVSCSLCHSKRHPTFFHMEKQQLPSTRSTADNSAAHGGEKRSSSDAISSRCTQVCGSRNGGKSCAKIIPVRVFSKSRPELSVKLYAMFDDQSNVSLGKSELFDSLCSSGRRIPYTITSCSGVSDSDGRTASDLVIESVDGNCQLDIPNLIECNQVPDLREEIPTPDVAKYHNHLHDISDFVAPFDADMKILLLIGRDVIDAHHVLDQRIGPRGAPYAQRLPLGWVIIGETCLGKIHQPDSVNVNKTILWNNGRTSLFTPCPNNFNVKEIDPVFNLTQDDDKPGLSVEDRQYSNIMDEEMYMGPEGNWTAPLPFKHSRPALPDNRNLALKRAHTLVRSLQQDSVKMEHFLQFMTKIFDKKHAEIAPPLEPNEEHWYLPIFGVYHPKKPGQIRAVFDSSATLQGTSLNNVLLQGPNLTNSLLGVLLRFRKEKVAFMADIESMFHCFQVRDDHRNYLRFFWFEENDPNKNLTEYRMRVHVFGNSPSPAVATYGLRKAAREGEKHFGQDTKLFVERDFYVDDGLKSCTTTEEAVSLLKRTQKSLFENGNLRLHKIVSNNTDLMQSFPHEDLAKDLKDLNLMEDSLPLQRSLGMLWNLEDDVFTFKVSPEEKPYTRRGMLSTVNSIFDPMGFIAPVSVHGKLLLRSAMVGKSSWDEPLDRQLEQEWDQWKSSLQLLHNLKIPRMFVPSSFDLSRKEVLVFCDASEQAIAAVIYLRITDNTEEIHTGFVHGKAKVAPTHGHTIPRLELCGAVLAVEIAESVTSHLDLPLDSVKYFTDSKIVLGYIKNSTRRFSVYISNRVQKIRKLSSLEQWSYISSSKNPADLATRPLETTRICDSLWIKGPTFGSHEGNDDQELTEDIMSEESQDELESNEHFSILTTKAIQKEGIGCERFQRFSEWKKLVRAIAFLKRFARRYRKDENLESTVDLQLESEKFIIQQVQLEEFCSEINSLKDKSSLSKDSRLLCLNPFLDESGLLRVGGRIRHADIATCEKNPLILHGSHYIATLLVRHFHAAIHHQGRHFTEGTVRSAGYWIVGGKRLISSLIYKCMKCRKVRGKLQTQKMADLPPDRLISSPPFTFVGVDTFGPWNISSRRTRGCLAQSKRWALLFTCLVCRAIHIEVVEDLSSSSFVNAVRRFISIRGKVKEFRSDRGTNFVGAVENEQMRNFLLDNKSEWKFNPPHSSHMGGVWERMIGVVRRILDNMLVNQSTRGLTHDVLCTFLAEVSAIVNGRPITPVSSDPESPFILTPQILLTQKSSQIVDCPFVETVNLGDLYKSQWKQVQALSESFWNRWRCEYLHTLQFRRKWQEGQRDLNTGDFVLVCEKNLHRNEWPVGVITEPIKSSDGHIRKASVKMFRNNKVSYLTRPTTDMVLLMSA